MLRILAAVHVALLIILAPSISVAQSFETDWDIIGIDRAAYLDEANSSVRNEMLLESHFIHDERFGLKGFCDHFLQVDLQTRRLGENADALRVQDACRNRQLDVVADALGLRAVFSDVRQGLGDAYIDDWVSTEYSLLISEALVEKITNIYEAHSGVLGVDISVYDLMVGNTRDNFCVFLSYSPQYESDPSEIDDLIDICEASARRLQGQISNGVNAGIRARNAIVRSFNSVQEELRMLSARTGEVNTRFEQIDRHHSEYDSLLAEDAQNMASSFEGRLRQAILLYLEILLHEKQMAIISLTTPNAPDTALLDEAVDDLEVNYQILSNVYMSALVTSNTRAQAEEADALAEEADALAEEADALAAVLWALQCVAGVKNGTYESRDDCPKP